MFRIGRFGHPLQTSKAGRPLKVGKARLPPSKSMFTVYKGEWHGGQRRGACSFLTCRLRDWTKFPENRAIGVAYRPRWTCSVFVASYLLFSLQKCVASLWLADVHALSKNITSPPYRTTPESLDKFYVRLRVNGVLKHCIAGEFWVILHRSFCRYIEASPDNVARSLQVLCH